ncbi:MAG: hypothetical protein GC185_10395 [Alphaproteobacteria bacterium]|nr:hypothetical protein [Alphaproteobacteria bacterium]
MKRLLLTLLVIAMLMPGLACAAMPCAKTMGAKTAPRHMAMKMPCSHCPKEKTTQHKDIMLMGDCSHTTLQTAGTQSLLPALELLHHDFIAAIDMPQEDQIALSGPYAIRGPPDGTAPPGATYPPLFLSTLRLRI